jgi:hypothetical protein
MGSWVLRGKKHVFVVFNVSFVEFSDVNPSSGFNCTMHNLNVCEMRLLFYHTDSISE